MMTKIGNAEQRDEQELTLLCEHMTAVSSMRRKPHPFVSLSTLFEISAVLFPHATIPGMERAGRDM
eukprot:3555822-Rhodomonas_salina.3